MKAQHWTLILLSILIAFVVASWGRVVEWWADLSPIYKTAAFVTTWAALILIGLRNGTYCALAGLIAGLLFIAAQVIILIKNWTKASP